LKEAMSQSNVKHTTTNGANNIDVATQSALNDPELVKLNKILAKKVGGYKVLSLGTVVLNREGWVKEEL
jgi:hypothetical protein